MSLSNVTMVSPSSSWQARRRQSTKSSFEDPNLRSAFPRSAGLSQSTSSRKTRSFSAVFYRGLRSPGHFLVVVQQVPENGIGIKQDAHVSVPLHGRTRLIPASSLQGLRMLKKRLRTMPSGAKTASRPRRRSVWQTSARPREMKFPCPDTEPPRLLSANCRS